MSIEFTQYVLPDGRRRLQWIDMPEEIETMARRFINAGGWYESEMLGDMRTVSLTACWERENGDNDIAIRVVENGPPVVDAVEQIVRESVAFLATLS